LRPTRQGLRPCAGAARSSSGPAGPAVTVLDVLDVMPHPIPYQGSKRRLAPRILSLVAGRRFATLHEPFAGSAAFTLAARAHGVADSYVIGDSLEPLVRIWSCVIESPDELADEYDRLWHEQLDVGREHFNHVRSDFNERGRPAALLYLLARCVKNAPRFNKLGGFSQSADHRRKGMRPDKMRREIHGAHHLLRNVTETRPGDAVGTLADAGADDLVYLDPPWQGTTEGPDKRYYQGFARQRLGVLLTSLNKRDVSWVLSYDGRCGDKTYGEPLPARLWGAHHELNAGRSSQATLVGRDDQTVESVYVSASLTDAIGQLPIDALAS
jgi:DNA adenine methylase